MSGPVWLIRRRENNFSALSEIKPRNVQPMALSLYWRRYPYCWSHGCKSRNVLHIILFKINLRGYQWKKCSLLRHVLIEIWINTAYRYMAVINFMDFTRCKLQHIWQLTHTYSFTGTIKQKRSPENPDNNQLFGAKAYLRSLYLLYLLVLFVLIGHTHCMKIKPIFKWNINNDLTYNTLYIT